ncbi:caspase family protein [Nonomuraea helvata]|uniref:caspase family protein n=1 Tax=Nonomuraea helvata TaxID=37484 RepID=UPI00366EC2FA
MSETTRLLLQVVDDAADPQELDEATARLRAELLELDVAASAAEAGAVPEGARAVLSFTVGGLVVALAGTELLGAIVNAVTAWLTRNQHRSVKLDIEGDVLELTGIASAEQRRLTEVWLRRRQPGTPARAGRRMALVVANDEYRDPGLRGLRAPALDAEALARVLGDEAIGGFDVRTMLNEPTAVINEAVEEFFADRHPDDLLLLHFSGHGVKDDSGELYFATPSTKLNRLAATAVSAEFVNRRMSRSRCRRVVLLLDCCYAGAFTRGALPRAGADVHVEEQFGGRGRVVITASNAMEYAFDGTDLADTRETSPSVFTSALVQGLETGDADRDLDGYVGIDELYDYVYDRVRAVTPNQTPGKWTFDVQGDLVIARRSRPVDRPAALPPELQEAIDHPIAKIRAGTIDALERLRHSRHAGLALAARLALEELADDDSRMVSAAAARVLAIPLRDPGAGPVHASATPPPGPGSGATRSPAAPLPPPAPSGTSDVGPPTRRSKAGPPSTPAKPAPPPRAGAAAGSGTATPGAAGEPALAGDGPSAAGDGPSAGGGGPSAGGGGPSAGGGGPSAPMTEPAVVPEPTAVAEAAQAQPAPGGAGAGSDTSTAHVPARAGIADDGVEPVAVVPRPDRAPGGRRWELVRRASALVAALLLMVGPANSSLGTARFPADLLGELPLWSILTAAAAAAIGLLPDGRRRAALLGVAAGSAALHLGLAAQLLRTGFPAQPMTTFVAGALLILVVVLTETALAHEGVGRAVAAVAGLLILSLIVIDLKAPRMVGETDGERLVLAVAGVLVLAVVVRAVTDWRAGHARRPVVLSTAASILIAAAMLSMYVDGSYEHEGAPAYLPVIVVLLVMTAQARRPRPESLTVVQFTLIVGLVHNTALLDTLPAFMITLFVAAICAGTAAFLDRDARPVG